MPTCYILSGVPGCGKSTWARNLQSKLPKYIEHVSRDEIRFSLLKSGEDYFAHEDEVLRLFYDCANKALSKGKNVILDATHTSTKAVSESLRRIHVPAKMVLVSFNIPLDVCLERNAQREGQECVPTHVVETMYRSKQKLDTYIRGGSFANQFSIMTIDYEEN